jgi:hypothetical protein
MAQPTPNGSGTRPRAAALLVLGLVVVVAVLVAVVDSRDTRPRVVGIPASSTPTTRALAPTTRATAPTTAADSPTTTIVARARASYTPTAAKPLRLWVGGDSLAAGPSWAVFEAAHATGVVKPLAEYQVGTGLVRNEFWDWPKHMDAVVRARDPQVSVFMVGANDDQPIEIGGTSYKPPDAQWIAEYRRRVREVMTTLTAGGRHLVWIGMPPMQDPAYSQSMGLLDGIMQQEAAKHRRVQYVDAWAMFSAAGAPPGTYAASVPDEQGTLVNMRLDDGIHLNVEGSQRLARAVLADIGQLAKLPPS